MSSKKIQLKHFLVFVLSLVFSIFVYGCSGSGSSSSGGGNTPPAVITSISIINAPEYLDFNKEYQLEIDKPELNIKKLTLIYIDHNNKVSEHEVQYLKKDVERMLKHYKKMLKQTMTLDRDKPIVF